MFRHNDIPANPIQDTNLELRLTYCYFLNRNKEMANARG